MKNILIFALLIIGMFACDNRKVVFPDYDKQIVYFPIQLPVRTLSMGEDRIDNSLDKEHKFDIGVCIGGMYENNKDWTVDYVVDPSLTDSAYIKVGLDVLPLIPLPPKYYKLSPENTVTIPAGSFNGLIRVELTDSFFTDPLATTGRYVVPLRITKTSADSILSGEPAIMGDTPDRRDIQAWKPGKAPKDWVLYGIKYINAYQGSYIHRGISIRTKRGVTDTTVFSSRDIVDNKIDKLFTKDLVTSATKFIGDHANYNFKYSMLINFNNSEGKTDSVTITPNPETRFVVYGKGKYFNKSESSESYNGTVWASMYLDYSYNYRRADYHIIDTLVFRDRGIKWEENSPLLLKK